MNTATLTNQQLTAALNAAMDAVQQTRGSSTLKKARWNALLAFKAEAQRRIEAGLW